MNTTDHLREQASAPGARTHARHADITRISKPDLAPDLLGERSERQQVYAGTLEVFGDLG
jgi:hypothetical protein